ncbi:hypothetical protein RYZ27_01985 [Hyphomonas sp. FCG-A18]|uniref:hypothetical protein n=1 Tax=Hyphomonas sp. FCG-A18 TaxID=3080019 RepID=UPI002B29509C|nr:hypothetical protein RYZ27_01985 [Hyphomonas sp. FCG-A18]
MGLWINQIDDIEIRGERTLYIYLLDYGWPDGQWEQLFKRHFMKMASMASETGAVVVGSEKGTHFSNSILSWHNVGHLDGERVLPGILITKTHPHYFRTGGEGFHSDPEEALGDLLVIPLKELCNDDADFVKTISGIFSDLKSGSELRNFKVADFDISSPNLRNRGRSIVDAVELKPGAFGVSVDIKKLIGKG